MGFQKITHFRQSAGENKACISAFFTAAAGEHFLKDSIFEVM
ncbi:MAG: hypothetical protein V2I97_12305 [Desulfococcaceae bacterium]|nr:hypothetical protein [Desulfococcaceae bacterium]